MKRWGVLALLVGLFLCAPAFARPADQAFRRVDRNIVRIHAHFLAGTCYNVGDADPSSPPKSFHAECDTAFNWRWRGHWKHRHGCKRSYWYYPDNYNYRPRLFVKGWIVCRRKPYRAPRNNAESAALLEADRSNP